MTLVIGACVSAVIGGLLALALNGRVGMGLLLGFLLGPIGWAIIFFLEDKRRRCPACRGIVDRRASVCLHCARPLAAESSRSHVAVDDEPFCVKCGVDGLKTVEMGVVTAVCPKCGQKL
ncbi:MAG: hypothetical protein WD738_01370 [Pirellulales bacterium]